MASPAWSVMSAKLNRGGQLRKEQKGDTDDESTDSGKEKKTKKGMFGELFWRKMDGSKTSMSSLSPLSQDRRHSEY